LSTRPTASVTGRGRTRPRRTTGPSGRGTQTSKRGTSSVATIASATSSAVTGLIEPFSWTPAVSSVRTWPGLMTLMSTPEPRSSRRTTSENPTTANFVAQ
jgi:hypothetical protein